MAASPGMLSFIAPVTERMEEAGEEQKVSSGMRSMSSIHTNNRVGGNAPCVLVSPLP